MEIKVKTFYGEVILKDVMIDFEGNLEEGVDVTLMGNFICSKKGFNAQEVARDEALITDWIYDILIND